MKRSAAAWLLALGLATAWAQPAAPANPTMATTATPAATAKPAPRAAARPAPRPATAASATAAAAPRPEGFAIAAAPAWVQASELEATLPAALPRAPVQLALLERQTRVGDTPAATQRYLRSVRQINEPAGLEAASRIEVEFDPQHQRLVLHGIAVLRGGQRIDKLDARQVKLLHREPQLERQMIDGRMTAVLLIDDLRVGDRVDWSYSLVGGNPVFGNRFVEMDWTQGSMGPAALYRYRLLAPTARNIRHQLGDASVQVETSLLADGWRQTLFTRRLVPNFHHDPHAPADVHLKNQLQLSEFADWAEVARWAERLFADAAQPGPLVRERAAQIQSQAHAQGGDAAARQQLALRLALDLVQTEVRYFGTEIGIHSHQPAAAEQVLKQRFGDCKDKVALMMALARELGLPARGLLVSTRTPQRVATLLPSPLAFDHAIVGVDVAGRTLWLDGTRGQQTGPVDQRQPLGLGQGLPAVAEPSATPLVALPGTADALRAEVEDLIRFGALSGDAQFESRQLLHGDLAEVLRSARAALPPPEFAQWLSGDLMRTYTGLTAVGEPQIEDLADRNAVRVVQRFTLRNPWRFPEQRMLTMDFGLYGLMNPLRLPDQTPRTLPLAIGFPGVYRHTLRTEYAEPMFARPSSQRADERGAAFELQVSYESQAQGQRISGELRLPADRIEAADWARHRDQLIKAWPRLSGTLSVPALSLARNEALRSRFAVLEDELRRGRVKAVTPVQRDAVARLLVLDEQLASDRLAPALRAEALVARGQQLDHLGRLDEGRQAFEQALALAPEQSDALAASAVNALLRGADGEALDLSNRALAAAPGQISPRYTRAYALYFRDDFAAARSELQQILQQRGEAERGYAPIWLYLADRRSGGDGVGALADLPPPSGKLVWPQAVLDHLRGSASLAQAEAAAREDARDGRADPGRLCELYFYAGQKALLDGDSRRGRQLLQQALDTGVVEFNEHAMARRALARLEAR